MSLRAAASATVYPTSVEPVKASFVSPGWLSKACPAVEPRPVMMFMTPGGSTSDTILPSSSKVSGVSDEGFMTVVFPAAMAGAIFHTAMAMGKFHGTICPTTPMGSRMMRLRVSWSRYVAPPSSALITDAKYRNISTTLGRSPSVVSLIGFPLSNVSIIASRLVSFSISSAILRRSLERSAGLVSFQISKADHAALTARSTSSAVASTNSDRTWPLAGHVVGILFPAVPFTHFPPISNPYSLSISACILETPFRAIVVMRNLPRRDVAKTLPTIIRSRVR